MASEPFSRSRYLIGLYRFHKIDASLNKLKWGADHVAGDSPAAGYLFLRGQENVTEKKAAQFAAPAYCEGGPALLDQPGGLRNSRTVSVTAH